MNQLQKSKGGPHDVLVSNDYDRHVFLNSLVIIYGSRNGDVSRLPGTVQQ